MESVFLTISRKNISMYKNKKIFFFVKLQGDSGGPVFIPVIIEKEDFSLTEEEILHLVQNNKTKNSGKTEAEIMNNIVRDPILIGVTRYFFIRFVII